MKKTISIALALVLLLSGTVSAFALTDTAGTVYETAVDALVEKGYVSGYTDETFRPGNTLTRAEAACIIVKFCGAATEDLSAAKDAGFSDMAGYKWAQPFVNYAVESGILSGYTDNTFRPAKEVTYAELAVMVVNAMGLKDKVTGSWAEGYIAVAQAEGYLEGAVDFDAAADVKTASTRGNTAIIVYNAELKKAPAEEPEEEDRVTSALSDFSGYAYGAINGYADVLNEDDEDVTEVEFVFGNGVQYLMTKKNFVPNEEPKFDGTLYCLQIRNGLVTKIGTEDTVASQNMKVKKFVELTNGAWELVTDRESNRVIFTEDTGYLGLNDDLLSVYVATIDGEDASISKLDQIDGYRPGSYKDIREDDMVRVYDVTYEKDDDGYGDVVFVVKE